MTEIKEHMTGNPHWEITFYRDGMSPEVKYFGTEEDAVKWWDENKLDNHMSLSSLCKVEAIRTIGWDRIERERNEK